jgi:hypothetical protein
MRDIRILFDPASQALAVRRRLSVTIEPPSLRADPFGTSHDRRCRTRDRSCLLRSVDRLPLCLRCAVMGDAMIIFRLLTCRHQLLAAHGRLAQFAGALRPRARVRSGRERIGFQRSLQISIVEADAYVDRQSKPYRSRFDGRQRPDVVVEPAGVLFLKRRVGSEDSAGGVSDHRLQRQRSVQTLGIELSQAGFRLLTVPHKRNRFSAAIKLVANSGSHRDRQNQNDKSYRFDQLVPLQALIEADHTLKRIEARQL